MSCKHVSLLSSPLLSLRNAPIDNVKILRHRAGRVKKAGAICARRRFFDKPLSELPIGDRLQGLP